MPDLAVYNSEGLKTGKIDLPDLFSGHVNKDVIYQVVVMYQANQRQGTASTKERAEVSGGGKKPFRQKGTGRARAGSIRSPLWRGGGTVFGPHPRDYRYTVPKKIKKMALKEVLKDKYINEDLFCVDQINIANAKTKNFAQFLLKFSLKKKKLALLDEMEDHLIKASRNIPNFRLLKVEQVNAYDILCSASLLITKPALQKLIKRLQ